MPNNQAGDGSQRASPRLTDAMPRYTLAELLTRSDYSQPQPPEEGNGPMRPP
jgi:hypothetical protein